MKDPERRMQTLRASEVHADDAARIIAIEAIHCSPRAGCGLYRLYASIEPIALVVCSGAGNRVVDLAPAQTSLEELKRNVPGLRALLAEDK